MPMSPQVTSLRNRHNVLRKFYDPDDPRVIEVRRQLKETVVAEYLQRQIAEAPPLTNEQRAKLAELLTP